MKQALILFAHGARDPRWAAPFERLRGLIAAQSPEITVELAYLELMTPQLPELIEQLVAQGCLEVTIVPVFFGQGSHVLRDLPLLAERLRLQYPDVNLRVASAVGEDAEVLAAIARYCIGSLA